MRRILLSLALLLLTLLFALPALAGNWGTMIWGATLAAVPTMGWLGGGLLLGLLPGGAPVVRTGDIGAAEMPA